MFKNCFFIIFLFLCWSLSGQENQTQLGVKVTVQSAVDQGSGNYLVTALIQDETNVYDGTDIAAGQNLWTKSLTLGDDCNKYQITDIGCGGCSILIGQVTVLVNDTDSQGAPTTGLGVMADTTFIGWVSGIGNDLNQCLQSFTMASIQTAIDGAGGGGSGEANTASNLGGDEGLFTTKSGVDLPFKGLSAGSGISLSSDASSVTVATNDVQIDHDQLLNFSANEHIDHSAVTLTAGTGLSGGGTIAASRTFDLDFSELSDITSIGNDVEFIVWDSGSGIEEKVTNQDLQEWIMDYLGVAIQSGTEINVAYADGPGTITINYNGTRIQNFNWGDGSTTVSVSNGNTIHTDGDTGIATSLSGGTVFVTQCFGCNTSEELNPQGEDIFLIQDGSDFQYRYTTLSNLSTLFNDTWLATELPLGNVSISTTNALMLDDGTDLTLSLSSSGGLDIDEDNGVDLRNYTTVTQYGLYGITQSFGQGQQDYYINIQTLSDDPQTRPVILMEKYVPTSSYLDFNGKPGPGEPIGTISWGGNGNSSAKIEAVTSEQWVTTTNRGANLEFHTYRNATAVGDLDTSRFTIYHDGFIGLANYIEDTKWSTLDSVLTYNKADKRIYLTAITDIVPEGTWLKPEMESGNDVEITTDNELWIHSISGNSEFILTPSELFVNMYPSGGDGSHFEMDGTNVQWTMGIGSDQTGIRLTDVIRFSYESGEGYNFIDSSPPNGVNDTLLMAWIGVSSTPIWINKTLFGSGGGGEANTASNLGGDEGLFTTKDGVNLPFKGLSAGSGIGLSSDANTVTISNTGLLTASNGLTKTGSDVLLGGTLTQNTIIDADGFNFEIQNANDIVLSSGSGFGSTFYGENFLVINSGSSVYIGNGDTFMEMSLAGAAEDQEVFLTSEQFTFQSPSTGVTRFEHSLASSHDLYMDFGISKSEPGLEAYDSSMFRIYIDSSGVLGDFDLLTLYHPEWNTDPNNLRASLWKFYDQFYLPRNPSTTPGDTSFWFTVGTGAGTTSSGWMLKDNFTITESQISDLEHSISVGEAGTVVGTRPEINFIEGSGTTLGIVDNPGQNRVDVTITSTGAGGGESNTASNQGTGGIGWFIQKTGVDLEFKNINTGSSKITLTDDTGNDEIDIDVDQTAIDHDQLLNFVADEHIAHSDVTMTAGTGLAGGGTIAASRTFDLDFSELSLVTAFEADDQAIIWDATTGAEERISKANLEASLDHDNLLNFVADEHVAHSEVIMTAGVGLTGGGSITVSRTFDLDFQELTLVSVMNNDKQVIIYDGGTGAEQRMDINDFEGQITITESQISDLSHYSSSDFDTDFAGKSTTDLSEGTNLYFTAERVDDRTAALIQNGTGLSWTYDDGSNTLTGNVQDNTTNQRVMVGEAGTVEGTRPEINFIEGTNITLTVADDAGNDRVNVTISGPAGSGEANTASNLGGDEGLFTTKDGVNLPFKGLSAGSGIGLSSDANTVTISLGTHAATHISAGSDEIDGDQLDIDWNPSTYTPTTAPSEASSVDHLTAHLAGIDSELAPLVNANVGSQSSGTVDLLSKQMYAVKIDMTGLSSITMTLNNPINSGVYVFIFLNADDGDTVTWSNALYEDGSSVSTDILAGGRRMITMIYDGTNYYTYL